MANLSIVSYNSQGSSPSRVEYVNKLVNLYDFVLIQEHWLRSCQFKQYENKFNNACSHSVSGMSDDMLLNGRPFGGCSIIWKKNIMAVVTPVNTQSNRICAVNVKSNDCNFLLCNVYMPCNNQNTIEFVETLGLLTSLCQAPSYEYVILGGDFNVNFDRVSDNHVNLLNDFILSNMLLNALLSDTQNVQYTYESKQNGHKSIIDHFFVSENLQNSVTSYISLHEGENCSDHSPIAICFDTNLFYSSMREEQKCINDINWVKATDVQISNYKHNLDMLLQDIDVNINSVFCKNLHCKDVLHHQQLQELHNNIINACITAGLDTIPLRGKAKNKTMPGWTDYVQSKKQECIYWHSIWKDAGSPRSGVLCNIRNSTRAKYHYAIRYVKNNRDVIVNNRMANNLLNNNTKSFWNDVKRVNYGKTKLPCNVDGQCGDENISSMFAEKYKSLYNSVSYDVNEMRCIQESIENDISNKCINGSCYNDHVINTNDVLKAVKTLNKNKMDGNCNQTSDHIINGPNRLFVLMSLLFQSMLNHGFVPSELLTSTVIPIPKGHKKSMNSSENYRGIALGSVMGKVFDRIILNQHWNSLKSTDMQFGFKPKHSTTQCSFVLNEIVQYYMNQGSNVYVCMLDASKAFDRVQYVKMFSLLVKRGLCPLASRVLATLYTNQSVNIKWGAIKSPNFNVSNGVKQGGILSPIMFVLYMDEMFIRLKATGYGCYIGRLFCGSLGYADDSMLLAPSVCSLKLMLDIVNKYGIEYDVLFNPEKNKLLCYSNNNAQIEGITYNNVFIKAETSTTHLGNPVGPGVKYGDIKSVTHKFIQAVNYVLAVFPKCHSNVKYQLFKTYCMPLYGAMLWDFSCNDMEYFFTQWRKCVRKIWALPPTTHCDLVHLICQDIPVKHQLHKRFIRFFLSLSSSENVYVSKCAQLALNGSCSNVCHSLNHVAYKNNIDKYSLGNICEFYSDALEKDLMAAGSIIDLCYLRDTGCSAFSRHEINDLLLFFCTN